ncbi:pentatricopeptide repeat-containing protein At4g14850 isoform X2 [Malania oleifera]|uniref:pentatricopeptide repeat-containing protein At4g14850 isoform X2 n=1 Tax=Malania oleifera TaxID=397392 RepID=UPI0025AE53B6|nr:pentatricopeptide repeat-containing protein At4g14850 isoform X2 [Malania oleifera]
MPFLTPNSLAVLVETAVSAHSSLSGRAAHACIVKTFPTPFPSFLSNHLVNMYSKLGLLDSASLVLSLTPASSRSVVTWTALIAGSVQNGYFASALLQFSDMCRESILPNDFTFPCLFKACASLFQPVTGKQLHALAVKAGQIADVFVGCGAFDMYCKTGLREDACKLFDEMPERNIVTWNAFITNSVLDGRPQKAIAAFIEFRNVDGEPNSITLCAFLNACSDASYLQLGRQLHGFVIRCGFEADVSITNGLIDFYGKCQQVESSEMIFVDIFKPNDVSWCSMVAAYVQNDEEEKACMIFLRSRKEGIKPADFMISSVLSACAGLAGLELGRSVHALAVKACVEWNIFVGSALVDMYGKCGSIKDSERAFDEMPERNLITWNAMICGYAHQGHADMAVVLFEEMTSGICEVVPNYVTLVCILSACSRAGSVKVGMEIFESMRERYGVEPGAEHYACVVDLLGRAGRVEDAYEFIKKMPIRPTISVWGALLGACRVYGKPELGKVAADSLFELDPHDPGNHVLLSNMFAAAGRFK